MFCPSNFSEYPWMQYAIGEWEHGVHKTPGVSNPAVKWYLSVVGQTNEELPWCSAFVNWCLQQAGYPITHLANARSWLTYKGANMCLASPRWGCVTVLWRPPDGPDPFLSGKGHVGFFVGDQGSKIELLGGNQSRRVQSKSFPKDHVLGYVWPRGPQVSKI